MSFYKKFSIEETAILNETFKSSSNYPSKSKIKELAESFETPLYKIENWFKYLRRKLYFNGNFQQSKVRKTFSQKEMDYLKRKFLENQNPDFKECQSIANKISHAKAHQIKNWFANHRRKIKIKGNNTESYGKNGKKSEIENSSKFLTKNIDFNENIVKMDKFLSKTESNLSQINFPDGKEKNAKKKTQVESINFKTKENNIINTIKVENSSQKIANYVQILPNYSKFQFVDNHLNDRSQNYLNQIFLENPPIIGSNPPFVEAYERPETKTLYFYIKSHPFKRNL